MIVYDRLHRLNAPGVNAYLFEDRYEGELGAETRLILIDTGMWGRPKILPYLTQLGYAPTDLTHILITHADIDHAGNLAAIQQATGATVLASEQSAALLLAGKPPSHGDDLLSKFIERTGTYRPLPETAPLEIVRDGDILPIMGGTHVLAAPGHTADQIAFHTPTNGIIYTGDTLRSGNDALTLFPSTFSFDHDLAKQSALKLLDRAPVLFACGHGAPFLHEIDQIEALFAAIR